MNPSSLRTHETTSHVASDSDSLLLDDVSVAYGRKVVLRGISARIERGQVVAVVGPNGGGKSTLLKAVIGTAPLAGGSITLFGRPAASARRRMALVPQREMVDWDFPVTVRDVVMMGRYPWLGRLRLPSRADAEVVDGMVERVGMRAMRGRQIGQLSGGQQQRTFLARALAQEAEVLLLDEPMTGIDAPTQELIIEIIEEERRKGRIILLATHDLAGATRACDCLCCLNERLVAFGPLEQTYTVENMAETFGGPVIMLGAPIAPAPSRERSLT